jgi:hypothetical protein
VAIIIALGFGSSWQLRLKSNDLDQAVTELARSNDGSTFRLRRLTRSVRAVARHLGPVSLLAPLWGQLDSEADVHRLRGRRCERMQRAITASSVLASGESRRRQYRSTATE